MKKRACRTIYPAGERVETGKPAARLLLDRELLWGKNDTINYWFYDKPKHWTTNKKEMDAVRKAFAVWKAVGIGLQIQM